MKYLFVSNQNKSLLLKTKATIKNAILKYIKYLYSTYVGEYR